MIVLSKANLVDEGIDLDEIKNSIRRDSILVGRSIRGDFRPCVDQLQAFHDRIQEVFNNHLNLFISVVY